MIKNISNKKLKEFGYLIGFGFPTILGWLIPSLWGHTFKGWTLIIGIVFLILAFLKPRILFYPYKVWMLFGHILGWINSRIILGVVYIIVLIPTALIMRSIGYDPLQQKKESKLSYKIDRSKYVSDLRKIF